MEVLGLLGRSPGLLFDSFKKLGEAVPLTVPLATVVLFAGEEGGSWNTVSPTAITYKIDINTNHVT